MLSRLKTLYERKSDVSLYTLQRKFCTCAYDKGEGTAANIIKLENLANCLKAHGEAVLTKMIISKILATIPFE